MEYHEAAEFLGSLRKHRPKLGVETTRTMLSHLGDPHEAVDSVQVTGSNGKGSTVELLGETLRAAGHDVGQFTSPGLNGIREQIRVNGRDIPKERVVEFVEAIQPCVESLAAADDEPTHFEVVTALALYHFAAADVDVAVLEVGIGGRYDATSAVDPVAAGVTSVSLEHTDLLGETTAEIARDKAQVAPADAPLVTAARGDALAAIREETDVVTVGADDADVTATSEGPVGETREAVSIRGPDWSVATRLQLLGAHQAANAGVAAALARQVADVDPTTIETGLARASLPGRFELVGRDPLVVLDGSHNPGAAATLSGLIERYDYDDLHLVFAAMTDKDRAGMVEHFPPAATVRLTRPRLQRAADPNALAEAFADRPAAVERIDSVAEATERALGAADPDDLVLVTGSLYAVAEARERWVRPVIEKSRGADLDPAAAFAGAAFEGASAEAFDGRALKTQFRPYQAAAVADAADDLGLVCERSAAGASGELTATVVGGSERDLRALSERVADAGVGLRWFADDVVASFSPPDPTPPFGGARTDVMGILNVTPDSFYDGGEYDEYDAAVERAREMVAAGADVIDVGGESTRPGADPVSVEEEIDRVVPVIEALSELSVPVSVDTRKAAVADAALAAGADVVNDVSGLADPEMRFVVADHDAALILMHSLSAPVDPSRPWTYDDVVEDVIDDLSERILAAERAGVDRDRIVVDPGCGFGKNPPGSFALLDRLPELAALGCPIMVGHSRKSMFGDCETPDGDRLSATLAGTAIAADRGAAVVRVHDPAENAAVVRTVAATREN